MDDKLKLLSYDGKVYYQVKTRMLSVADDASKVKRTISDDVKRPFLLTIDVIKLTTIKTTFLDYASSC